MVNDLASPATTAVKRKFLSGTGIHLLAMLWKAGDRGPWKQPCRTRMKITMNGLTAAAVGRKRPQTAEAAKPPPNRYFPPNLSTRSPPRNAVKKLPKAIEPRMTPWVSVLHSRSPDASCIEQVQSLIKQKGSYIESKMNWVQAPVDPSI